MEKVTPELDRRDELLIELGRVKVRLPDHLETGEVPPSSEEVLEAMLNAGWSGDPGTGHAVILPDGSELLDPRPMAPPVDYDKSADAFTLWQQNLQRLANIRDLGNAVLDESAEDAEDFDVPDPEDVILLNSVYTDMFPEAPGLGGSAGPVTAVDPELAKAAALEATAGGKDGTSDGAK